MAGLPAAAPSSAVPGAPYEEIDVFAAWGVRALTTTRAAGSFSVAGDEPVGQVMARWSALRQALGEAGARFATASQVHGARIITHAGGWAGWLRGDGADGHATRERATSFAVSVADCVPVFVAHPGGAVALLHAGWRGTAAGILPAALRLLATWGLDARELHVHFGPAICGRCYEVSADVYGQITGQAVEHPARVDLRAVLADQAHAAGVRLVSASEACTRCHHDRFYSHRGGDAGRQLGVIASPG